MIKRIMNWLEHHGDKGFFYKTEDGRELFYPWAIPGEAFYTDGTQKKQLNILIYSLCALFLSHILILIFFENQVPSQTFWKIAEFLLTLSYFPTYILGVFFITRRSEQYAAPKAQRLPKKSLRFIMPLLLFALLTSLFLEVKTFSNSPMLNNTIAFIITAEIIFFAYFFIKIESSKGCFFYREPRHR